MKTLSHTTFLGGFTALLVLAWGANLRYGAGLPAGDTLWVIRAETLNLSGLLAVGLMSLIMVLATRPAWLEKPLGGMDRIYRTHKWAGILAGIAVLVHWAADEAGGPIRNLIGRSGKVAREHGPELYESLHHLGKDVGEWALYPLLGLILLTLLRWFPFKPWRLLHRAMPALYLMGAFHGLLLAPLAWWQQPLGWLMALLIAAGSWGAVLSLLGRIGRHRQYRGEILQVEEPAPGLTTLTCRLESRWPGHRAGQFVFLTLHAREGSHPFTIASAPGKTARSPSPSRPWGTTPATWPPGSGPARPCAWRAPTAASISREKSPRCGLPAASGSPPSWPGSKPWARLPTPR